MATLTHDEAIRRADLLTVDSYTVDLDLTRGAERFGSRTVIRFRCAEPGATSFAELRPVRLHSAVLNGVPLDPAGLDDNRLLLPDLAAENELLVTAEMAYSHTGEGLHRYVDPADGEVYLYAQTFLDHAQRMFGCFDQPDLKAPVTLSVTAPPQWSVLGNAAGRQVSPGRWEFAETRPLSTYFVTVAAGRWHSAYAEHDGIPLGIHARQSYAKALDADTDEILTITRQCLDRYHALFDQRYPFGKYDQVFVPEFNAGAMENPGCVTIRDEQFLYRSAASEAQREMRAMVIAHEMAHMWFGDLVTMRWWDDMWLNESFAEYMGHRVTADATRFLDAWVSFSLERKAWGYAADQRPSTHPVAGPVPDAAQALLTFDGISYAKGASALRQLVAWLGDEAFLAGINDYFARHAYGNASLADLLAALQAHTDRDLGRWADKWLTTAQLNTLRPEFAVDAEGRLANVEIEQTAPEGYPTLRPHRIGVGLYDVAADGAVRRRRLVEVDVEPRRRTAVPVLAGEPAPALLLLNDGDLTYAKVRFDPDSWATVAARLHRVEDTLSRTLLWGAAWELVRDGELPVGSYLRLIADHLPYEASVGALDAVLRWAKPLAVDRYTTPQRRTEALATLATACRELLGRAAPGGSAQLIAARGLAGCAVDAADLDALAGWLAVPAGSAVPDGLPIDPELRWLVLRRLAVTGRAGERQIAAELARDPGDEAQRGAHRCRAALPDPAAKAAAWASIVDGDLTPHLLLATVQGFWQSEQAELLADYLPRYFAAVPAVTARRDSIEIDRVLTRFGFPEYAVSAEVVAQVEKLLAADDVRPGVARFLSDQLDETRRALRARTGG
ncbi:MAG: aminopeptidase N [Micromonosporaceae bacterium]